MSNPLKRTHVNSSSSQPLDEAPNATTSPPTQPHPSLWFKDGSIVFRTQTTLFKVHQSTLASHSSVFAGMFNMPQPPGQEIIQDCPVVDMPDSADDFARLLKAMYEPT